MKDYFPASDSVKREFEEPHLFGVLSSNYSPYVWMCARVLVAYAM